MDNYIKELLANASKAYYDMWEDFYKDNSVFGAINYIPSNAQIRFFSDWPRTFYAGGQPAGVSDLIASSYIRYGLFPDRPPAWYEEINEYQFETISEWLKFKLIAREYESTRLPKSTNSISLYGGNRGSGKTAMGARRKEDIHPL